MGEYLFRLPDVGEGTVEAEIIAWYVKAGDMVEEDQPLVDVMTDKATVEITSPVHGRVRSTTGLAGDRAAVGATLVVFETEVSVRPNPEANPPLVPNPTGQRNIDARDPPPTTPATESHGPRGGAAPADAAARKPIVEQPAETAVAPPAPDMMGQGDYQFRLPDVGEGTAEAEIVTWHVKPGDDVEEDKPLVDVMTDKATVEITSPIAGRVVSINGEPGRMAAVGSTLVVFSRRGGTATPAPDSPPAAQPSPPVGDLSRAPAFHHREGERPLASPAVRRQARESGIDLATVAGTGPGGRILREDLPREAAPSAAPAPAPAPSQPQPVAEAGAAGEFEDIRIIGLRRKIAEKMQESKRRIPHFAYIEEVDVTELEDLRGHLNATKRADQPKLTLLPFLIRALVRALPAYPQINARYDDEAGVLRRYAAVHLGMATQTAQGLIVPVIRDAQARDLWGLAAEISRLAKATRDGTATRQELTGSTLTLTSLGPLGGVAHTPVINHPEVAIIGPNKIIERPVVRQGQIVVRKMMNISGSFDHRVVDGYDAAEFVQTLKGLLEYPATLFMA